MHPAWLPLSTRFELGDYGVWRGGVFTALGNVREFGAELEVVDGEPVALDFQSRGVVIADASAAGSAAAQSVVDAAVDLSIVAEDAESFILQAPVLTSRRIANVAAVAAAIARRSGKDGPRWRSRYKFVAELFAGERVTILATSEARTTITLRGRASDPRELLKGGLDAALSADKSLALSLVGAAGPVGLRLVRIGVAGVGVSFDGGAGDDGDAPPPVLTEDRWDDDPEDDPDDAGDGAEAAERAG